MSEPAVMARPAGLFDDEHVAYRDSVRTHLARTAVPEFEAWSRDGDIPDAALQAAAEHGFVATGVPEAQGGLGLADPRFPAIVVEEAVRAGMPALALVLAAHGDVPVRALAASDDAAAPGWLERLGTAELRAASVLHAPVRAREDGTLEGRAPAVVGGAAAGLFVVAVAGADPYVVAVERDAPGVAVEVIDEPVGLRAAGLAELVLDGARGVVLEGVEVEGLVLGERVLLAVAAAAAARWALDITLAYVTDRKAFGTPIASFENTAQLLGAVAAELHGAQALVDQALAALVAGSLSPADAAAAKLLASEVLGRAVDAGVQLHGGYGYIVEYPISHAYADARFLRLCGGTSQALRGEVAADLLARG